MAAVWIKPNRQVSLTLNKFRIIVRFCGGKSRTTKQLLTPLMLILINIATYLKHIKVGHSAPLL